MSSTAVMTLPSQRASIPVAIPISGLKRELISKQKVNQSCATKTFHEHPENQVDSRRPNETESSHDSEEEEEFRLPDGSPTFSAVMSEMSSSISKTSVRDHVKIPVLPMVAADSIVTHPIDSSFGRHVPYATEDHTPGMNSPPSSDSPATPRKGIISPNRAPVPRARSYSWNHRNKIVVDRRKALSVSFHPDTNSNHSTPTMQRKTKRKPRPSTSLPSNIHPKYKILTENLTVSHDDLVKEQERERHLADGFSEVKSIFQSRHFDRLGISPKNAS